MRLHRLGFPYLLATVLWLASVVLVCAQAPAITAPPLSKIAVVGQAVSFSVTATGVAPLTYQWKRNGQVIAGANSATLTIPAMSLADRGWYQVIVSNPSGAVKSVFMLNGASSGRAPGSWTSGASLGGGMLRWRNIPPAGLSDVVAIASDSVALKSDGTVVTWPWTEETGATSSTIVPVPSGLNNVVAIAAGAGVLAVKADGTVVAWGSNISGPLTVPPDLDHVVAVACGVQTWLALRADGSVVEVGSNPSGPRPMPSGLNGVVAIAAGLFFSVAARDDGTVVSWGEMGVPDGLGNVVALASSYEHVLALRSDGTVVAWGRNTEGEATVPTGLSNVVGIAANISSSFALKSDGTVVGWGYGAYAALPIPAGIAGVEAISAGGNGNLVLMPAAVPQISVQPATTMVTSGGRVTLSVAPAGTPPFSYRWKKDGVALSDGARMSGSATSQLVIDPVTAADAGSYTAEVTNGFGTTASNAAVLTVNLPPTIMTRPLSTIATLGQPVSFSIAATGGEPLSYQWKHNGQAIAGAINATLTIPSVGYSSRGNYEVIVSTPLASAESVFYVNVSAGPPSQTGVVQWGGQTGVVFTSVGGAVDSPPSITGDIVAVASSDDAGLLLRGDGTVASWGGNNVFQSAFVPSGLSNVVAIAIATDHSLALKADGVPVSWGARGGIPAGLGAVVAVAAGRRNDVFLKADGNVVISSSGTVIGPTVELIDVTSVAAGYDFYLALKKDVTVGVSLTAPAGLAGVVAVAAGEHHAVALKSDGTVVAWGGANADGETNVPVGLANVIAVAAGASHSMALKADGTIVVWGRSAEKQSPPPSGLVNVVGIAAGGNSSVALVRAMLPAISIQPVGGVRNVGKFISLSIGASGQPTPAYQWSKDGVALTDGGKIAGAASAQLTISNAQSGDAGSYTVAVTNGLGTVTSSAAQIAMVVPPVVTVRPMSRIVLVGQAATFTADVTDVLPLTFLWKHNGQVVPSATSKVFSLASAARGDAGCYEFVATNSAGGTVHSTFNLSVVPDHCVLTTWGAATYGQTLVPSGLFDLRGVVAGGHDNIVIKSDGSLAAWGDSSASPNVPAGLTNVVAASVGGQQVLALKDDGSVVTWNLPFSGVVASQPAGLTNVVAVAAGDVFNLALRADGTVVGWGHYSDVQVPIPATLDDAVGVSANGSLGLILRADGSILALGSGTGVTVPSISGNVIAVAAGGSQGLALRADGTVVGWGGVAPPLGLSNVTAISSGYTQNLALKADGSVVEWGTGSTSPPAGLADVAAISVAGSLGLALAVTHPPSITTQPVSRNVNSGSTVTFTAAASGTPPLAYQWKYNGLDMKNGDNVSGATTATLTLTNVQGADVGSYTVTVTNPYGSATSNTVTLTGPPPIPGQGQATTIAGNNFTLSTTTSNSTATYQWRRNGVAIVGATGSSYVINGVSRGDAANYDVVTTNGTNSAASSIARLLVAPTSYPGKIAIDPSINVAAEIVSGWVYTTAIAPDGKIYVGGEFSSINRKLLSRVARFNADGSLDNSFVPVALNGAVLSILPLADGRVWIGGDFFNVKGVTRSYSRLLRLLADGSLDESVAEGSPDSSVLALALQSDGKLLFGGLFASSAQNINAYLARLNADGTMDAVFRPSVFNVSTGGIWAIAVQGDGKIVAGGRFNFAGSSSLRSGSCIARFNVDGTLDSTFGNNALGANNNVYQVALQADGKILVCGAFTTVNGTSAVRIARLTSTGALDPTFSGGAGFNASALAMQLQSDGKIVVGGSFTTYNTASAQTLVRLNADGSRDVSFTQVPNNSVGGIARQADGRLVIVGYFYGIGTSYRFGVARINTDGSLDPGLNPLPLFPGTVNALLPLPAGKVLVGGDFQFLGGVAVSDNIARLNANLSVDTTFNASGSGADDVVTHLAAVGDGRIWVGGSFTHFNGVARGKVVRLNADGSVDTQFNSGSGTDVAPKAMVELTGARLGIGGEFSSYSGQSINDVAVIQADGTLDLTFSPGLGTGAGVSGVTIRAMLAQPNNKLLVAGQFPSFNGQFADSLVRILANGAVDSSFPVGSSLFSVSALRMQADARFLLGGDSLLVRLNADGTRNTLFTPPSLHVVDDFIAQEDGKILVRGIVGAFDGAADTANIVRLNANGTRDTSFDVRGITSRPSAFLLTDSGCMLIGGGGTPGLAVTVSLLPPTFSLQPQSQTANEGGSVTLTATPSGVGPFSYQWTKDGHDIVGANSASLTLANLQLTNAGSYAVVVVGPGGTATSAAAVLAVASLSGHGLVNSAAIISAQAGSTIYAAFTVEGTEPKQFLVRAVGPTLANFSVTGFMADPRLVIVNSQITEIVDNDDWGTAANVDQILSATLQTGAYPLKPGSKDAATFVTLAPGTYRVYLAGATSNEGIVSLEIYEVGTTPRLVYLATRGAVGAGATFAPAFTVAPSPLGRSYLIRALGPSLGVPGALADPQLTVLIGTTQVARNDNWSGDDTLVALSQSVGAMPLPLTSKDAALNLIPSAAGAVYNVSVEGVGGSSGKVLLEVFEVDARRAATIPVALVATPENITVDAGQPANFGVVAIGKPQPGYQWSKGDLPIAGADRPSFSIPAAQLGDAGRYTVVVSNGTVPAQGYSVELTVNAINNASQAVLGSGYVAGSTVAVTNTLYYVGVPTSLGWSVTLPTGWSFVSDAGSVGGAKPVVGATGTLAWTWSAPPQSPVTFTYILNVPAGDTGDKLLSATATVQAGSTAQFSPRPTPLIIRQVVWHSADTNRDGKLSLTELLRVIELYNARNGTVRTGAYAVDAANTEDGFATDPTRLNTAVVTLAKFHSADTNRDGKLSLTELLRMIELYNHRTGTVRDGIYHVDPANTEDGFGAGP